MARAGDRPDLHELVGSEVTQITLDYEVGLLLVSQGEGGATGPVSARLTIGTDLDLVDADGQVVRVVTDTGEGFGALPVLLRLRVLDVRVGADESLVVHLSTGHQLRVPRDLQHESWAVHGRGVRGWIAGPS